MLKNKLDYKLLNLAIFVFIIFLIYQSNSFWIGALNKFLQISLPFLFAFAIAYALSPMVNFLTKKGTPKALAISIVLLSIMGVFALTVFMVVPLLVGQLSSLFNGIITFLVEMSNKYDINFGPLQETLSKSFNDIIMNLGKYVSDGAIGFIDVSLAYITIFVIVLSASVYFLIDIENIRIGIKAYLNKKSKKSYDFIQSLDHAMKNYLSGFMKIVLISAIEYTIAFLIIGHPNALLLGFLAAIAQIIPYFGGMFASFIAAITAFVISPALFIKTIITFLVLGILDSYVINPLVYGKSNKLHPNVVILAVFAGGILFGVVGIILSLPVAILIITTFEFFREDIKKMIDDLKDENR